MNCEWCGKSCDREGSVHAEGHYFCSRGCFSSWETETKFKNKSGVMAGLGQMAEGSLSGSISADNIVGGAAKVAGGLVFGGVKAIGGLGRMVGNYMEAKAEEDRVAAEKAEARRKAIAERKAEKEESFKQVAAGESQKVSGIDLSGGAEFAVVGGINALFGKIEEIAAIAEFKEELKDDDDIENESNLETKEKWAIIEPVYDAAWEKADGGLAALYSMSPLGRSISEFIEESVFEKRPKESQKEAAKRILERQKQKILDSLDAIQPTQDTPEGCSRAVIGLFDIVENCKKIMTSEKRTGKKELNAMFGPVRMNALGKIDPLLGGLKDRGPEGLAFSELFVKTLSWESNLKFSEVTGKFHDKDNMPLLASAGEMIGGVKDKLASLNPFAKKEEAGGEAEPGEARPELAETAKAMKNKLGEVAGLFGFGKRR